MKILFATSSFKGGGITSYALEVIDHYSADNEIIVFVGKESIPKIEGRNIKFFNFEANDVSVVNALNAIHAINDIIIPDVIINSNSKLISFITPFLRNTIKIVSVSHSLRYLETNVASINNQFLDAIIALSFYNKQYIDRRFCVKNKAKTRVVYNFVAEGYDVETVLSKKKKSSTLNIIFMGGTSGSKTPELVLQVVKELLKTDLDFHFYWLGTTSPTLKKFQPFNDISELLPKDKRLIITGRIPRAGAESICRDANIIIIPSRREGCPMALIECMRYGVISLTSDYKNACRELINNNYNGFVLPHNSKEQFYKVICEIINHHNKYLDFYDNSIEVYKSRLSFPIWKQQMDEILYSNQLNHYQRRASFSYFLYIKNKVKFALLNGVDSIHQFVYETLPSAISFFVEFIKSKNTKTT